MELHIYLKSKKLSREEFAESIAVSPMTVWRYLNGDRKPSEDKMKLIFKVTGGLVDANGFYKLSKNSKHKSSKQPLQLPASP